MALTGTGDVLGAAIKSAIDSLSDEEKQNRDEIFKAIGEAIIAHIIANGIGAVAGVTTGAGVANII